MIIGMQIEVFYVYHDLVAYIYKILFVSRVLLKLLSGMGVINTFKDL